MEFGDTRMQKITMRNECRRNFYKDEGKSKKANNADTSAYVHVRTTQ